MLERASESLLSWVIRMKCRKGCAQANFKDGMYCRSTFASCMQHAITLFPTRRADGDFLTIFKTGLKDASISLSALSGSFNVPMRILGTVSPVNHRWYDIRSLLHLQHQVTNLQLQASIMEGHLIAFVSCIPPNLEECNDPICHI